MVSKEGTLFHGFNLGRRVYQNPDTACSELETNPVESDRLTACRKSGMATDGSSGSAATLLNLPGSSVLQHDDAPVHPVLAQASNPNSSHVSYLAQT
jgi:hypothetical protein